MPTCGGLRIGVLRSEPKTPPLVIVNVPPFRSASDSVPSSARLANSRICCSISANDMRSASRSTGHDEPFARADGDADVVVVLEHHLVALDLGVDARKRAQRADRRLDEERRDPEADAVAFLERLLVPLAQRHDRRHVDFVEGREHRGGALRFDQPPGDRRAPLRHAHALFGALARAARGASATGGAGARLGLTARAPAAWRPAIPA